MSTLYLVATPIGNLEDITTRALRILAGVSLIAAEDTRHTAKLLQHYDIHTPSISYHEHNKLVRLERVLQAPAVGSPSAFGKVRSGSRRMLRQSGMDRGSRSSEMP